MSRKLIVHAAIWVAFLVFFTVQFYWDSGSFSPFMGVFLIMNLTLFYVNYLLLVPRLLLQKKTLAYVFWVLVVLAITGFLRNLGQYYYPPPFHAPPFSDRPKPPFFEIFQFLIPLLVSLAFIVGGTSIRIYEEWNRIALKKKEIEAFKISTELHFLKTQLSPHFLFNSLNSIYSLITKKSDDAAEAVIILSELMRYMLYQTDHEYVALQNELTYIQNYIKLQRLRVAHNEHININIHGNINDQKIRPLLLISFIENAFKHGTDFKGNTEVSITIFVNADTFEFNCVNLIGNKKKDLNNSGIGLKNTEDRIELLYPQKHNLEIYEKEHQFFVKLKLNLN